MTRIKKHATMKKNISLSFFGKVRQTRHCVYFAMPGAQQNGVAQALLLLDKVPDVDPAAVCDDGDLLHFGGAFIRHAVRPFAPAGRWGRAAVLGEARLFRPNGAYRNRRIGVYTQGSLGRCMVLRFQSNNRKTDCQKCRVVPCSISFRCLSFLQNVLADYAFRLLRIPPSHAPICNRFKSAAFTCGDGFTSQSGLHPATICR